MRRGLVSLFILVFILFGYSFVSNWVNKPSDLSMEFHQPSWEVRARKVAQTCGYRFRAPPQLELLTNTEYEFLMKHLLVSENAKLIYCYVPKVGCSNWKRLLATIEGHEVRKLSGYSRREQMFMLKHYYKMAFVRHPIDRLVSAYRNKFGEIETFQSRFGVNIVEEFRPQSEMRTGLGNDVTFQEFVEYLYAQRNISREFWNEHWSPMVNLCQPCLVHFNGIGEYQVINLSSLHLVLPLSVTQL